MKKYRIQRLYKVIDGIDYMRGYVTGFKKIGSLYKAHCPFHNEKTPSFIMYPKGVVTSHGEQMHDSFYCFGCGAGGDILTFYSLLNGVNREEALRELEVEYGLAEVTDLQAEIEYIKEEIKLVKSKSVKHLSFSDVNMSISICCRKYLEFIKKYYNEMYASQKKMIDGYYRYIDYILPDCNDKDANLLYEKIYNRLEEKKKKLLLGD